MNESLSEAQVRVCQKCGFDGATAETKCPVCGRLLVTKSRMRFLGGVILALGVFIAVMMAGILANLYPAIMQPDGTSKFTGTETQGRQVLAILGLTLVAGVLFSVAGLWQLVYGVRNRLLAYLPILIVLAVVVIGVIFVRGAKH